MLSFYFNTLLSGQHIRATANSPTRPESHVRVLSCFLSSIFSLSLERGAWNQSGPCALPASRPCVRVSIFFRCSCCSKHRTSCQEHSVPQASLTPNTLQTGADACDLSGRARDPCTPLPLLGPRRAPRRQRLEVCSGVPRPRSCLCKNRQDLVMLFTPAAPPGTWFGTRHQATAAQPRPRARQVHTQLRCRGGAGTPSLPHAVGRTADGRRVSGGTMSIHATWASAQGPLA